MAINYKRSLVPDTPKVQDNITIGRHIHTCRESISEREKNSTKMIQKNFAEDSLFKSIEDTSPQIKHKTIIHSINPKNYQEINRRDTNYFNTLHSYQQLPHQLVQSNLNMFSTSNNNIITTSSNNSINSSGGGDKKGLVLAGVFQDVLKNSPIKKQEGSDSMKSLSQREESGKGTDTSKTNSNIEDGDVDGDDEEKYSNSSSDHSSSHKGRNSSYTEEENDSIEFDIHKSKKRRDHAKDVFDLLDEVNDDNKNNKLANKYLEFNRSFIYNKTMPSH